MTQFVCIILRAQNYKLRSEKWQSPWKAIIQVCQLLPYIRAAACLTCELFWVGLVTA